MPSSRGQPPGRKVRVTLGSSLVQSGSTGEAATLSFQASWQVLLVPESLTSIRMQPGRGVSQKSAVLALLVSVLGDALLVSELEPQAARARVEARAINNRVLRVFMAARLAEGPLDGNAWK